MLFISTGIFDDKLHPQILSVGTTANAALISFIYKKKQLNCTTVQENLLSLTFENHCVMIVLGVYYMYASLEQFLFIPTDLL